MERYHFIPAGTNIHLALTDPNGKAYRVPSNMKGMELLAVMPRGSGALGFYEHPGERTLIKSVRIAADVPEKERTALEVLRTDTPTFAAYLEARRNRREEWFKVPAGRIDLCNVPIAVREPAPIAPQSP